MSDSSTPEHGEVLSFGDAAPAPHEAGPGSAQGSGSGGGRRLWPFAVGGVAALAVGGAGVALGLMVGGGGVQPEDVMPAGAVMYADIDFDPGADQKLNMMRMLGEFPEVRERLGGRDDARAWVLSEVFSGSAVDPDEVGDWVGDRAGVALVWDGPGTGPTVVIAVQVTDEGAAEEALLQEVEREELAFSQGYAIVAPSLTDEGLGFGVDGQTAAQVVASAQSSALSDDADFVAAMNPLGSGIASGYIDGVGFTEMVEDQVSYMTLMYQSQMMGQELDGVTAVVIKAEPDAFALDGYSTQSGLSSVATPTQLVDELPDSTMFAFAFTGGGEAVAEGWQDYIDQMEDLAGMGVEREIRKVESTYNLQLPEDIVTLLGEDAVIAVDGEEIAISPGVGYRSVTDPTAAKSLADRIQPMLDMYLGGFGATARPTDDGLVMASTPQYADTLVDGPGGLLDDPRAQEALVDVESAAYVAWVDMDSASSIARLVGDETADVLEPMAALGVTVVPEGEGWSVHARLTFDE